MADGRLGKHARPLKYVGVDYGFWATMGSDSLSLVRSSRYARVIPGSTNDADPVRLDFKEHRTAELCSAVAYTKTGQ